MSSVDTAPNTGLVDVIDVNIIPDLYVTYIVDVWDGPRHDPATQAERYICVFAHESPALQTEDGGAKDPDFGAVAEKWRSRYSDPSGKGDDPLVWKHLQDIKVADRESKFFKDQQEKYADPENYRYSYGTEKTRAQLYNDFMDAVDTLVTDPDNAVAWEAVEKWRKFNAERHER